jgi:hypothetical protein
MVMVMVTVPASRTKATVSTERLSTYKTGTTIATTVVTITLVFIASVVIIVDTMTEPAGGGEMKV